MNYARRSFGYKGDDVLHPILRTLHNIGLIAGPLAFLIIGFAILPASVSVATSVRNPLARRLLWTALAVIAVLLLALIAISTLGAG